MKLIKQLILSYWKKIRNVNFPNFVFLVVLIGLSVVLVKYYSILLETAGNTIILNHKHFIWYIIPSCIAIGYAHARFNKDKEYNPLLLKFFSSPLIVSSMVCLTYGVVIDSSLALLFIVLYDKAYISTYPYLDSITVTVTLILALLWGLFGILSMIGSIMWPIKTPIGITEKKEETPDQ